MINKSESEILYERNSIPIGPIKEFTPEKKEKNDRDMEHIMREYGVLGTDEKIENGKINKSCDNIYKN